MKSVEGESPKESKTELDLAEIHDFLYVDKAKVSALYAQLFPQGLLTTVKTTALETTNDENNLGTDIKIIKADTKTMEGTAEGIEHQFDASWSVPLEVLAKLAKRSLIKSTPVNAGLGAIVLSDCYLRVIDFAGMANLWEPTFKLATMQGTHNQMDPAAIPSLVEALKATPSAIHAHYLTDNAMLWSSLIASNLTIPTTDLSLKFGGEVSGRWRVLYAVDCWPGDGSAPDTNLWSGGGVIDGILAAMHGLRILMGRPLGWWGITPLMIFRDHKGWLLKTD